jgi:4a-hydroxytetrahydrobiopterin dehydratase
MEKRELTDAEIVEALNQLPGWAVEKGKLFKAYKFGSFPEALGWMVSCGVYADKIDHHPEWSNIYNRVQVRLVTHDLGNKISTLDVALAKEMDRLAG